MFRSLVNIFAWGSTAEERARAMVGDAYLDGGPKSRVHMTRAVTIAAPPERVWPWIAQIGRGAGWYSVDALDNGRKTSARHVVSWVPEPKRGDATAIGYLRDIEPGRSMAWWVGGTRFFGAEARLVSSYLIEAHGRGTRLVSRMSADASGATRHLALGVFRVVDSVMATSQLVNLRERIECAEAHPGAPRDPETGSRAQYQLYEALYADGESAGSAGREHAATWRRLAIADDALQGETVRGGPEHETHRRV